MGQQVVKRILGVFAVILALAGCSALGSNAPQETAEQSNPGEYRLGPGDTLRVIVFGEEQLSGQFAVDGAGNVALPLIGAVKAKDETPRELEKNISAKLAEGYVRDPKVSVEVTSFRPFFIIGEVNQPGRYPFVNGMTAISAVAMAGGYTYRGNQDYILVTRGRDPTHTERRAPVNAQIFPDDVVRIPERYF
jgi:polysaccharide export outer membrane protein